MNVGYQIKSFLTNKNTVSIILGIVAVLVLWLGYNYRIQQQTSPTTVPYARERIPSRTQITADMISTADVPLAMIKGDIITDTSAIINKYVNVDSAIPEGSLFYVGSVVDQKDLPDAILYDYPDDWVLVNLSVNTEDTYGNKIYPENYIDIYIKATNRVDINNLTSDTEDKIMVGKLLRNVKVLAVLDANGLDVFEDSENVRTPSQILFAVPEEYHILLRKAMYLRTYEVAIIPVPTNESLKTEPGEVSISSESLKDFINDVTEFTDYDLSQDTGSLTTPSTTTPTPAQ